MENACLKTNQEGEFNLKDFSDCFCQEAIKKSRTTSYSPQQSEVVERRNITFLDMV